MSQASDEEGQLGDREKAVQQISQMWYNNMNDDEIDLENMNMPVLMKEMGEVCEAHGLEEPDERLETILEGIREAMEMQVDQAMETMEESLRAHFRMFGL